MITNVRIGNDIKLIWQILKGGQPVDLTGATDVKVSVFQGGNSSCGNVYIDTFKITDAVNGILSVEIPKEVITEVGYMWTVLEYTLHDDDMIDGDRKVTVDNVPVRIVSLTAEASQVYEFNVSSDILAGFHGKSAFEVWLTQNPDKTEEDYFNWLQKPATDAVSLIDDKIEHLDEVIDSSTENEAERVGAETLRLQSENLRVSAETERKANEVERLANESSRASDELIREANESSRKQDEATRKTNENEREIAETTRVSNENNRVTAEQARVDAEIVREQQELERQANTAIAIDNANNAKGWTPSIAFEEYNGKQIKKLVGYIGGTGVEPTANVGQYFTENGFTDNKDLAVNFKGTDGVDGDSIVNINPSSTMQQARIWIGTRNEYDIQKPLPNDVITFIL